MTMSRGRTLSSDTAVTFPAYSFSLTLSLSAACSFTICSTAVSMTFATVLSKMSSSVASSFFLHTLVSLLKTPSLTLASFLSYWPDVFLQEVACDSSIRPCAAMTSLPMGSILTMVLWSMAPVAITLFSILTVALFLVTVTLLTKSGSARSPSFTMTPSSEAGVSFSVGGRPLDYSSL